MRGASGSNRECRPAAAKRCSTWVAIATLCLAVHGCDTVTGGAVELSWKLRPASSSLDQKFVDCDFLPSPISKIQLHWIVIPNDANAADAQGQAAWNCQDNHGVTGFDLPEGTARLWVTPECEDGPASPDTYIAPAIVERTVGLGDTVSLGAVELVVSVSYCGPMMPCICLSNLALDHTKR